MLGRFFYCFLFLLCCYLFIALMAELASFLFFIFFESNLNNSLVELVAWGVMERRVGVRL